MNEEILIIRARIRKLSEKIKKEFAAIDIIQGECDHRMVYSYDIYNYICEKCGKHGELSYD